MTAFTLHVFRDPVCVIITFQTTVPSAPALGARHTKPPPQKRVASVVVKDCKLPKAVPQQKLTTIPIPASLDEIKDDGMRAFFDERSGEEMEI